MFYPFKLLLLCCLLCCVVPAQADPAQRSFADWQVTCNNLNLCLARNTGQHQGLVMTLERGEKGDIGVGLRREAGLQRSVLAPQSHFMSRLELDGEPLVLAGKWHSSEHMLFTDDAATVDAFLHTIGEGEVITLKQGPGKLSLKGFNAALAYINARPRHTAASTPEAAAGVKQAYSVPPLSSQERSALLDYAAWRMNTSRCSLSPMRQSVRAYALSNTTALVLVNCEAGAWNIVDLAWFVSRSEPVTATPVQLVLPFQPPGHGRRLELMNSVFDEQTGELRTLKKNRGIGDCGVATRWRFDGQQFRLIRYAAEPACDGWHGPVGWPVLWINHPLSATLAP
ncbi:MULTISPECIES: DUF1176 domain-containing protein [Tenebrionibacter/Tenebrionicola group]|jgi:hypothetical protein|uniref:DUF1176 domain-containing protein n=2 Tax=Tenebrionibacter/Tenebrionicola group TaxID=2969848 RepID=A0A8K0V790_9ENTR|nr:MULTISPECIES: DUF1176 domain-containing protein [Tenebrionibacter/Tenebrionicola group]MBK4715512.1 DUF1176 domain-containing protein [Tenebrionibacter intestinalis]MBV5094955.1 DUF1176 domain-containing protein [Tenebrionicola larvae]